MRVLKRPNSRQSGASFRYEQVLQLESTGSCLVWNIVNKLGLVVERHVIPTAMAVPMPPMPDLPFGGWRIDPGASRYSFPLVDNDPQGFVESYGYFYAVGAVIPAEPVDADGRLTILKDGTPIGFVQKIDWPHPIYKNDGYSPEAASAHWADTGSQIDRTRWAQMKNQASPTLIIEAPPDVGVTEEELDRAAKKFNEKYAGPEHAGEALFTSSGAKITPVGPPPSEMGYDKGFEQMRDAVLAAHGVPPIAAGAATAGSYAAFYAQLKQFSHLTMQPILELLAEEDTERLAPQFGPGLTIEYEAAHIDDPEVLERRLATDIAAGAITKKELRELRGLPPFGDYRDGQFAGFLSPQDQAPSPSQPPRPQLADRNGDRNRRPDETTTGEPGVPRLSAGLQPMKRIHQNRNCHRLEQILS